MANMPLMQPSKFQSYNDNPNGMLILLVVGMAMPLILLVLRLVARKVERIGWWWDDAFAVLSSLLFVAGFWADIEVVRYNSHDVEPLLLRAYILNILYPLIVSTARISALLLYLLHFGQNRLSARFAYLLITAIIAWMLATVFVTAFQCMPVSNAWSALIPVNEGSCLDRPIMFLSTGVADAALDLAILVLPLPTVLRLDLGFRGWVSLAQVYIAGLFVLASSSLRAYYALSFVPSATQTSPDPSNPATSTATLLAPITTYTPFFLWSTLSASFALQTISMPTILPALTALFTCSCEEPRERARRRANERVGRLMSRDKWLRQDQEKTAAANRHMPTKPRAWWKDWSRAGYLARHRWFYGKKWDAREEYASRHEDERVSDGHAKLARLKEELELEILEERVMGVEISVGDEERLLGALGREAGRMGKREGIGVAF